MQENPLLTQLQSAYLNKITYSIYFFFKHELRTISPEGTTQSIIQIV